MSTLDICIRNVANRISPGAALDERFKLRQTMAELVEWQKNGGGVPISQYHKTLLAHVNAEYQREIRKEIRRPLFVETEDLTF